MPKAGEVLSGLEKVSGILSIGIPAAGTIIPLIKGVVLMVRSLTNSQGEVEYTVVLKLGKDELDQASVANTEVIAGVNEELAKLGHPPLT
jgi:hypothetical protein